MSIKTTKTVEKSPCEKLIDNKVQKAADGYYRLPSSLDLEGYPQGVIDSFLDFFKDSTKKEFDMIIRMIKSGEIKMDCLDNSDS